MSKPKILHWGILILAAGSCTIIEDGDITDPDVPSKILTAEIRGETQDGPSPLGSATFLYNAEGKITTINWTGLKTMGEFRFRAGALKPTSGLQSTAFLTEPSTANVVTNFDEYDSNGRIKVLTNSANGTDFESYRFGYDNQGRVNSVTTIYGNLTDFPCLVTGTDCGGEALMLKDTIIYSGTKINYIKRQVYSGNPKHQMAIYIGYGQQPGSFNFSGSTDDIGSFAIKEFSNMSGIPTAETNIFSTDQFQTSNRYSFFQNEPGNWYGGPMDFSNPSGIFPFIGNLDMRVVVRGVIFAAINFQDLRLYGDGSFQNEQSGRSDYRNRLPDYYYFHPFWMFVNQFTNGEQLAQLYFTDWWIVNQDTGVTFQFTQNRTYKISFAFTP